MCRASAMKTFLKRILTPFVQLREDESVTLVLMFAYSFFAMAGYNVVKPATRSQFIDKLGATNLPYVLLATGLLMSFVTVDYKTHEEACCRDGMCFPERNWSWLDC